MNKYTIFLLLLLIPTEIIAGGFLEAYGRSNATENLNSTIQNFNQTTYKIRQLEIEQQQRELERIKMMQEIQLMKQQEEFIRRQNLELQRQQEEARKQKQIQESSGRNLPNKTLSENERPKVGPRPACVPPLLCD